MSLALLYLAQDRVRLIPEPSGEGGQAHTQVTSDQLAEPPTELGAERGIATGLRHNMTVA